MEFHQSWGSKTMSTRILGIESSCDETAAAIVADGREILSSVVASQMDIHRKYGGVVSQMASREPLRQIVPGVREALPQGGRFFPPLRALGGARGPRVIGPRVGGGSRGQRA